LELSARNVECDNLNFMNFKIDSLKIRKNSWILGTLQIHKIRILNLWLKSVCASSSDFDLHKTFYYSIIDPIEFLPRDAMRKRGLCCRPVSVRMSVCHVGALYPDGWRYRQTSLSARYPIILVFWTSAPVPNSTENTFSGGGKILRFSTEIAVYLGNGTR